MLFRDGKPSPPTEQPSAPNGLTPEMLQYLMEGISAKISENLKVQHLNSQMGGASAEDSAETLQRLAQAMTTSSKVEGKNFEGLGEVKKVESDPNKAKKTLDLLKDIK